MVYFTQLLIDAVLLGGVYTLMAIGLSLSYGVARVINFAHGELVMLGAYAAFWCFSLLGLDPLLAIPAVAVLGIVGGFVVFRLTIMPVLDLPAESDPVDLRHRPHLAKSCGYGLVGG